MANSQPTHLKVVSSSGPSGAVLDALAGAITSEVRLLEDLVGIMRGQRTAVATDDLEGVDDSVFAIHRVLVTLGEARRHRRALNELLGTSEDLALRELEDFLGEHMTDPLRFARDGLRAAALTLSQEVELNRQVLREALYTGTDYVRSLYGVSEVPSTYGANVRRSEAETTGGALINRRA
jgi:hypothetical protein